MPTGSDGLLLRLARTRPAPRAGIVHLGPGAFFRSFVAACTQDAINAHGGDWGIVAVSLNSALARDQLEPQGGVFTATALAPTGRTNRVIDCIARVLVAPEDPAAVIAAMADPAIRLVTLTITEKGYGHDPATGRLNYTHPAIAHDIAYPGAPRSAMGFLVAALAARRAAGTPPFTVLSCDNLAHNGALSRSMVLDLARAQAGAADLADWIAAHVAFPNCMVDRITPAMTEADHAAIARQTGVHDAAAVQHEPFLQWVIEDRFPDRPDARPRWEAAGAQFTRDVAPFEAMKLRCLNGAHSALAYLGSLAGLESIAEAATDPLFAGYLHRAWTTEIIPTLTAPEGVDLPAYCDTLLARFANPAVRHRLLQIAADGSQKLPQRLLAPMGALHAAGRPAPCLSLAVAGWMHHLATAELNDPLADRLRTAAGDVDAILSIRAVFDPALAAEPVFRASIAEAHASIAKRGVRGAVAALQGA